MDKEAYGKVNYSTRFADRTCLACGRPKRQDLALGFELVNINKS